MPGAGLLHLKCERRHRGGREPSSRVRAAVGGVRPERGGLSAGRRRDAIQGWARRREGDEGEAGEAVAKSKFEEPGNRRRGKKTEEQRGGKGPQRDQRPGRGTTVKILQVQGSWRVTRKHLEGRGPEAE